MCPFTIAQYGDGLFLFRNSTVAEVGHDYRGRGCGGVDAFQRINDDKASRCSVAAPKVGEYSLHCIILILGHKIECVWLIVLSGPERTCRSERLHGAGDPRPQFNFDRAQVPSGWKMRSFGPVSPQD